MHHAETRLEKMRLFVTILWPILITQLSFYVVNVINTMMSGRVGTVDLAGVAVGTNLWHPIFTGFNGILLAVSPIVAQYMGSGERHKIAQSVTQAIYLSVLLAILVIVVGFFAVDPVLSLLHVDEDVGHIARHYLAGLSIGIVPMFVAHVLRYFLDAQGLTRLSMLIAVLGIPMNVLLSYALIFGKFGLPQLGGIGAGYAVGITFWFMLFISIAIVMNVERLRVYKLFVRWSVPSWRAWMEQLKLGLPMGLSIFFEASIFSVVTILVAVMFDTITIAAHQSALTFTSLLFMIPLSLSMAITILVGFEIGAKRYQHARQYSSLGVMSAVGILGLATVFLYIFREPISYLYTKDIQVIAMMKQFFLFAIFYQLSDAAQVSLQGVLRGYKDVTVPFIVALISYWLIGLPAGYGLAAHTALGPFGFWIGITIGLTSAAIGFFVRLRIVQRRFE